MQPLPFHSRQEPGRRLVAQLALQESFEPESHVDSNWISRHRFEFDATCEGCHDVSDPGGISDTSFCGNSACHATEWTYAGFNAPSIVELTNVLDSQLPTYPEADLTWDDLVGPILAARCVACHGGTAGLYLDSYDGVMAGGNFGAGHRARQCRREPAGRATARGPSQQPRPR